MAGEFTLQAQFHLLHMTASQLTDEQTDRLGELEMGLEPLHDLGAEAGNVDRTAGRQTQQHITDLLRHIDRHILLGLFRRCTEVGRQHQTTLHRPQGGVFRQGLTGIHIQARTGDHTVVDGFSDRRLIHHAAAGTVHDPRRGLHGAQQLRIHQVLGVLGARDVQGDVVGGAEQLIQLQQLHLHPLSPVSGNEGVVGDHLHAHGLGNPGDVGSDLAETDHPQSLLVELVADVFLAVPLAGPHAAMGLRNVPREGQHHRQSVLRCSDGVALRRVHHQHTPLGGGRHINVVDADAGAADDLEATRRRDHRCSHLGDGTDHQSVVLTDDPDQLLLREAGALIHLRHLAKDVDPGLVDRIGDKNFRHRKAQNCRGEL